MKNLLGRLMSRPFDELHVIEAAWGTLTNEPNLGQNDLAIALYHTMLEPSAVRGVWEGLPPEERAFIGWLLNQRNMLSLADDLPAHLDRPPQEVEALVERLRRVGLLDVDEALVRGSRVVSSGDNLYSWANHSRAEAVRRRVVSISTEGGKVLRSIAEEAAQYADAPPFDQSFAGLLDSLSQEDVQRIATAWQLPEAARYYKSELIGVMSEFLAAGQGRDMLLSQLPACSQQLFSYLLEQGGKDTATGLRRHFGWEEKELRQAALPLVHLALVWDVLVGDRRYLFAPRDLSNGGASAGGGTSAPETAGPTKAVPQLQLKLEAPAPYSVESRMSYELPWDLLTLLSIAAQGGLQLTLQDNRITKRLAKKINEAFLQPVDLKAGSDYMDVVAHVAQALGLLQRNDQKEADAQPILTLTDRAEEWAKLSFEAQRRRVYGLWQEDRKWAEPAAYGTIYWWNSDLTGARKRLARHLLEVPTGQWTSLDAFLRRVHLEEPFIIWPQDELVRRFGLRALQGFRNQWFGIEGRIIADMLKTMLFWLGAVELGRDKPKRFVSFRVTPQGRALLDPEYIAGAGTPAAPDKTLLVQPNFEVLVLHPDSPVIWRLMQMADLVRHDRVSVYTLNKESVMRAVESGAAPKELADFLLANTGKALPQNVEHSISDWGGMLKRLAIQRATLVQVDDAAVLDELMASRKTRRMIVERLSPTTAIARLPDVPDTAREDAWQRLAKELHQVGYVPTVLPELRGAELESGTPAKSPRRSGGREEAGGEQKEAGRTRTRTKSAPASEMPDRKTGTS